MALPSRVFFVSVIIPIFNTDEYLEEAIKSIIEQTLDFKRHIQLILVNDGSTDSSAIICRKYQVKHPDNVIFIDQANEGVCSARNRGLEKATGKYINFLDSDDKWSLDAFECFYNFFQSHPETHIATAKHIFFGRKTSNHPLMYKYDVDHMIDIMSDYTYPHLSLSNAIILKDLFRPNPFNGILEISEDFYVFNEIILAERYYATLCKPVYWYRKRIDSSSAIDSSSNKISWYTSTPKYCYEALFALSKKIYGTVVSYIQFCVMYDLQWRIKNRTTHPLNEKQYISYKAQIVRLLSEIDDQIIVAQRNMNRAEKIYALSLKYDTTTTDIIQAIEINETYAFWRKSNNDFLKLWNIEECKEIRIDFISQNKDGLTIEGRLPHPLPLDIIDLFAKDRTGNVYHALLSTCFDKYQSGFFDEEYYHQILFRLHVPMQSFMINLTIGNKNVTPNIVFGKFCPLSWGRFSHVEIGDYTLTTNRPARITVKKKTSTGIIVQEAKYQMIQWLKYPKTRSLLKYRRDAIKYWKSNPSRQIWLISDRIIMAGDNGESLFTYLQYNPIENVDVFFIISEESKDYDRLKKIGTVLAYGSHQHKFMMLCANAIISSAGEDEVFNAFGEMGYLFKSIVRYKYIFLQHGVTKDDISSWLNRRNKNIKLFITAAFREYDSILHNPHYGYEEESLALTGFPRHDKLLSCASQEPANLLIAPTWRQYLAPEYLYDRNTGIHKQNPVFEKSAYFLFYNRLINDKRIMDAAKRNKITVRFLIHPALIQEIPKFRSNFCEIVSDYNYADEFANAKIMITDYSSVAFDYALLKRPIIYAQFDEKDFFSSHLYTKGYFDYRADGFGAVYTSYEKTVEHILFHLDNPVIEVKYAQRIDDFFFWPNEPRCELVTKCIKKILD